MFANDARDEFAAFIRALAITGQGGEVAAAGAIVDCPAHFNHAGVFGGGGVEVLSRYLM